MAMTTKKRSSTFWGKKCPPTPWRKFWQRLCTYVSVGCMIGRQVTQKCRWDLFTFCNGRLELSTMVVICHLFHYC